MPGISTEKKLFKIGMTRRIRRCAIHTQRTSRRTRRTRLSEASSCVGLLSHFSPTSRARSPDMLSSTASSRVARPAHIRSTFSSSADHIRTREIDRPPTRHQKKTSTTPPSSLLSSAPLRSGSLVATASRVSCCLLFYCYTFTSLLEVCRCAMGSVGRYID
jgi:hypothetical protein